MEKYHGFDQHFYDFLFAKIVSDGGLRMQLIASDLGTLHTIELNSCRPSSTPKTHSTSTENNMETSSKHSKPSKANLILSWITWS